MFTYLKRTFLNPKSTQFASYIMAVVESSEGGEYRLGTNMLTLADCERVVTFEFVLTSARSRKQSLAKIDLMIAVLMAFRKALRQEARLIEKYKWPRPEKLVIECPRTGDSYVTEKPSAKKRA